MKQQHRSWWHTARQCLCSPFSIFLLGALLGGAYFLSLFSPSIIDPTNVTWIFSRGGDVHQHYMGWHFFRSSAWSFPLGMIDGLAYPQGVPLVFMDAIPLFALLLKPFAGLLPGQFQYLGAFTLLSFVLQGGVAALIMRRLSRHIGVILLGTSFFILAPMLIDRSFSHTALTAQWIILLGIYLLIRTKQAGTVRYWRFIAAWTGLLSLAVLIHPYFFPMVLALYVIASIYAYRTENPLRSLRYLVPPVVAIMLFGAIGGLTPTKHNLDPIDLDLYGMNLASPVDPKGYSRIMGRQLFEDTRYTPESGEKTNYLGLGVLALLPVVFVTALLWLNQRGWAGVKRLITWRHGLAGLVLVGLYVVALGSTIKFGSHVFMVWQLPHAITQLWLVFRSSGRMFWPIYYLIITGVLAVCIRMVASQTTRRVGLVTMLCLAPFALLQFVDIRASEQVGNKRHQMSQQFLSHYKPSREANDITKHYCQRRHLVALEQYTSHDDFVHVSQGAIACNMTLTEGYYAHDYKRPERDQFVAGERARLTQGTADVRTNLYVTRDAALASQLRAHYQVDTHGPWHYIRAQR
ncbi:hypothetical protein HG440_001475 [Candidatus Saccharibacteria bacterium]|nr:hypothetical protein [Candidatus Saccharibacteria bacterium]